MRRTAYLESIRQAAELPTSIPELKGYFNDGYNPRLEAIAYIKRKAREDTKALFDCEAIEVLQAGHKALSADRS